MRVFLTILGFILGYSASLKANSLPIWQHYYQAGNYYYALGELKKTIFYQQLEGRSNWPSLWMTSYLSLLHGELGDSRDYFDRAVLTIKDDLQAQRFLSQLEMDLTLYGKSARPEIENAPNFLPLAQRYLRRYKTEMTDLEFDDFRFRSMLALGQLKDFTTIKTLSQASFGAAFQIPVAKFQEELSLREATPWLWRLGSIIPGLGYLGSGEIWRAVLSLATVTSLAYAGYSLYLNGYSASATVVSAIALKFYLDSIFESAKLQNQRKEERFAKFLEEQRQKMEAGSSNLFSITVVKRIMAAN